MPPLSPQAPTTRRRGLDAQVAGPGGAGSPGPVRSRPPALSQDELAFYDAVAENESALTEMGTGVLTEIARDLVQTLRSSVTVDWVSRDDVRAKVRSIIKRLLAKHGYPPDAQPEATERVIRQMETFAEEWSPASDR